MIQQMFTIWSPVPLCFLNPAWYTVHVLLKPGLENFQHYFFSMWDKCNCVVVLPFFGIAFLWDWNEMDFSSSVATVEFSKFAGIWSAALSEHHLSGFEIAQQEFHHLHWPSSKWFLLRPSWLNHSRMSGSRRVITASWLSGSWIFLYGSSGYSCHLFLISSASVKPIPFLSCSLLCPSLHEIFSWYL